LKTIKLAVKNIVCQSCVKTICEYLSNEEAVDNVTVDEQSGVVIIEGKNNLNSKQIEMKLEALGYPVIAEKNYEKWKILFSFS